MHSRNFVLYMDVGNLKHTFAHTFQYQMYTVQVQLFYVLSSDSTSYLIFNPQSHNQTERIVLSLDRDPS